MAEGRALYAQVQPRPRRSASGGVDVGWNLLLGTGFLDCAGCDTTCGRKDAADVRYEMSHAVGDGTYNHNTEGQHLDVLLELKVAIQCDEDFTHLTGTTEKFAVLDTRPAQAVNRYNFVASQKLCEVCWEVFVKQDAHRP